MANYLRNAIRYQQEMEEANRPATVNSLMARKAAAIKQNAPAENMLTQYAQTMPQNWQQFGQNMAQAYPTPATGGTRDQIMAAVKEAAVNAGPLMTVFHGSPHRFDKFDASKIGTGEGAQAYGHGLYLAENPKVAKEYMSAGLDEAGFKKQFSAIVPKLDEIMSPIDPLWKHRSVESKTDSLWKAFSANEYGAMDLLDGMSKNEAMAARIVAKENRPFSMYKVDLPDEHIAKMLEWDKPLSQQPTILKTVNDFLASKEVGRYTGTSPLSGFFYYKHGPAAIPIGPGNDLQDAISKLTGNKAYDLFKSGGNDSVSSAYLKNAGIPGIRYLDGGSRAGGQGTSNFVVFPGNEGLLKILDRK